MFSNKVTDEPGENAILDGHLSDMQNEDNDNLNELMLVWRDLIIKRKKKLLIKNENLPHFDTSNSSTFAQSSNIKLKKKSSKYVFQNLNGFARGSQVTGIFGPNGCGKSNLLYTLAGRNSKKLYTGNISFYIEENEEIKTDTVQESTTDISNGLNKKMQSNKDIRIAFIPYTNIFYEHLTVKEILIIAIKCAHPNRPKIHKDSKSLNEEFKHLVLLLRLENVINVAANKLSIGQRKRLSIGEELAFRPDVLILDKPTSGLDSAAAYDCLRLFHELSRLWSPLLILCSISQPGAETFSQLDLIHLFSYEGELLYMGSALHVDDFFIQKAIPRPPFTSVYQHMLRIANGELGEDVLNHMSTKISNNITISTLEDLAKSLGEYLPNEQNEEKCNLKLYSIPIDKCINTSNASFKRNFRCVLSRYWWLMIEDFAYFKLRLILYILSGLIVGLMYSRGVSSGCTLDNISNHSLGLNQSDLRSFMHLSQLRMSSLIHIMDSSSNIFFSLVLVTITCSLPALISLPIELAVIKRELRNGHYSFGSFFAAKTLFDSLLIILLPNVHVIIVYLLSGQPMQRTRLIITTETLAFMALIADSQSLIVASFAAPNVFISVYIGLITILPTLLFAGYLIKVNTMPKVMQQVSRFVACRNAYEIILIGQHGLDRCKVADSNTLTQLNMSKQLFISLFNNLAMQISDAKKNMHKASLLLGPKSNLQNTLIRLLLTSNALRNQSELNEITSQTFDIIDLSNENNLSPLQQSINQSIDFDDENILNTINLNRWPEYEAYQFKEHQLSSLVNSLFRLMGVDKPEKQITHESRMLKLFGINESTLNEKYLFLLLNYLILRLIAFFVLRWRC